MRLWCNLIYGLEVICIKHVGTVINNWLVCRRLTEKDKDGHALYEVECVKCKYRAVKRISSLYVRDGNSCNHYKKTIHKWIYPRLQRILSNMLNRCYNPNDKNFRFYGACSIEVCPEWRNDHKAFEDWALANGYHDGLTIDRVNPKLGYNPSNCRWISQEDNSRWKSTTNVIEVDNIKDTGRGWARRLNLSINHINTYLRKNGYEKTINYIKALL